jgi:tetratricopeptide (TPR) repeat protein
VGDNRVARKPKHHTALRSTTDLEARVRKALREDRSQQALELAKQLDRQEPTPAHRQLLVEAYLSRARHLRQQGYTRDAQDVLETGAARGTLEGIDRKWLEKFAEEFAALGSLRRAEELLAQLPESPSRAHVLTQGVDSALRRGKAGRALLPESLQEPFDRIIQAFAYQEARQDDQAREVLQSIGLQSPFLEWKLLLRGLAAFYRGDDPRALENWQRLNAERLPARLVAPLRFAIDPAFRASQQPAAQAALQRQVDRLMDVGPVTSLRPIQAALATGKQIAQAFRQAENMLPALRQSHPHLVGRLASCFYWAIVQHGVPEDMHRYQRVFGEPADDPGFARLQALVYEHDGNFQRAHEEWQRFERTVATNPSAWSADQAVRVRALIWCHMGRNAAKVPNEQQISQLPPFLRNHPDRPKPLRPDAEECFRRSLELVPDQLEAHEELFHYYQRGEKHDKAEQVGRQLLERFPDHVPALEALADLRIESQDYPEGLVLLQRALKVNPLDRRLRSKLGTTHLFNARAHAEAGRFDAARVEYQTCLALDSCSQSGVLCKWAACEFKAGERARGEELLQQALSKAGLPITIAFSMLIEAIRLKLPRQFKTRFDKAFKEALAEPPTASGIVSILDTAAIHRAAGVQYVGQKTHEKKVLAYADQALRAVDFTEDQLQMVCRALLGLEAWKPLRQFAALGARRFPKNPLFPLLEAESYLAQNRRRPQLWRAAPLLFEASRLASELPPEDPNKALLEEIQERQEMIRGLNPLNAMFEAFGGMFGSGQGDWDEQGAWDDEDDWYEADDWDDDAFDDFDRPRPRGRRKRR